MATWRLSIGLERYTKRKTRTGKDTKQSCIAMRYGNTFAKIANWENESKNVPVMRLVGLQIFFRFYYGARHVGCSSNKEILPRIKNHLRKV